MPIRDYLGGRDVSREIAIFKSKYSYFNYLPMAPGICPHSGFWGRVVRGFLIALAKKKRLRDKQGEVIL
jgi:hypothetical protein